MRAKPNKPDIHIRLEKWMMEQIKQLAEITGWNYTRVIESALEPGLNWLRKERKKKMNPEAPKEKQQETPSPKDQKNNKQIQEIIEAAKAQFKEDQK